MPSPEAPMLSNNHSVLQGLRILVVDNDVDSCSLISTMLQIYAVDTQVAFSASQALDAIQQFRPDVLISDIAMPEENGYSLLQKVRAQETEEFPLPAIAVTAMVSDEDRALAMAAGFQRWLPKPIDMDRLIETIATMTDRSENCPV
ncbi:response regulator [Leptolyngbya sp. FACHB-36]|uniref:response regulator n=1 Tax=Leptolyngbya sp. FACHB-36 TaxID=2692808 RepID=UPI001680DF6A|nr:response regulator [Leptolyngbya sp. FACHB-36]MBD2021837.1 response regulator [Leptolyngbya sp. FACHB-36]